VTGEKLVTHDTRADLTRQDRVLLILKRNILFIAAVLVTSGLCLLLVSDSGAEPPCKLFLSCLIGVPAAVAITFAFAKCARK